MQEITLKAYSFDYVSIDLTVSTIIAEAKKTGAKVNGPIPLPNKRKSFVTNRSPHKYTTSKHKYELITHSRLINIICTDDTMVMLSKLAIPQAVRIEIKETGVSSR